MLSVATDICVATGDWTSVRAGVHSVAGVIGVANEIEIKPRDAATQAPPSQAAALIMAIRRAARRKVASVFSESRQDGGERLTKVQEQ